VIVAQTVYNTSDRNLGRFGIRFDKNRSIQDLVIASPIGNSQLKRNRSNLGDRITKIGPIEIQVIVKFLNCQVHR